MKIIKAVKIAAISAIFGGVGFFVWRYSSINSHVEKLRTDGQLDAYLKKFSESHSYQFDEMIQTLENQYSRKVIQSYKKTLISMASGNILETCAGNNRNLQYYNPHSKLTLLDWNEELISIGSLKGNPFVDYQYVLGNVKQMPFKDNQFDAVVDIFGLQYVSDPEKTLAQIQRVCKPNGKILLMNVGISSNWKYQLYESFIWGKHMFQAGYFINIDWEKIISQSNFEIEFHQRKNNGKLYVYILNNNKENPKPSFL